MSYNIHYALAHFMMIIYNIKLDIEAELILYLKKYTILKSTKRHRKKRKQILCRWVTNAWARPHTQRQRSPAQKKRVRKHSPIHVYLVAKVFKVLLHF